jgi:hypothetical protein
VRRQLLLQGTTFDCINTYTCTIAVKVIRVLYSPVQGLRNFFLRRNAIRGVVEKTNKK